MTETECYDCGYAEHCDWDKIMENIMSKNSRRCVAKVWHDTSVKVFWDKTEQIRANIVTVGDFCKIERDFMGRD